MTRGSLQGRQWSRRFLMSGAGAVGMAGVAAAYRAAPSFWRQFSREFNRPILTSPEAPRPQNWPDQGLHAAWLGHSTVLLKIDGFTILTDPVFSDRAGIGLGPVTLGLKRVVAPALEIASLPKIDLILLSHAHMDHFDLPSLRALESRKTEVVTAWETTDLLRVERYRKVRELRWDQTISVGPVRLRGLEVNHWGARVRTDTYRGYNGYLLEAGARRVLIAGDTADTGAFRHLKTSRAIDLAVMPIGAYNPWIRFHCTPEQAWRMGNEAGAEFFLPVHHQTFDLGREPRWEPLERLYKAAGRESGRILVQNIGQELRLA